jgi:hypothetical protein
MPVGSASGHVEPIDMDRDAADLLAQCPTDGVANGGIHLARDLRHWDAEGDRQVEVDLDPVVEPDRQSGLRQPETGEGSRHRSARECGDAIRPEGRGTDDVGEGATGDEGSAGCRTDGHAGSVLPAGRGRALLERWSGLRPTRKSGRERVLSYRPARADLPVASIRHRL